MTSVPESRSRLTISRDGRRIGRERFEVNQWGGCSLEMRIPEEPER